MLLQQAYLLELRLQVRVSIIPGRRRYFAFILLNETSLLPTCSLQDEASSESVKKKTKIDEHDTETKPATAATSITGRKDVFDLEDLANLVCLALSDYAIWADVDLRRKIDWGNNQDHYDDDTDKSIDDNNGCTYFHIILN